MLDCLEKYLLDLIRENRDDYQNYDFLHDAHDQDYDDGYHDCNHTDDFHYG